MTPFIRDDLERLRNKKVMDAGYGPTQEGYALVILVKAKEFYFFSETPIELEIRDVQ